MPTIELFNEDCMQGMKRYPDKYFELAIVDPPYGIGMSMALAKVSNTHYGKAAAPKAYYAYKEWDKNIPTEDYFNELFRISKNQILWGGNYYPLPLVRGWIFWDKCNGDNDFGDGELAWSSFDKPIKKFTFMWNGMLQGDMANKETRIHPTQKPVKLYEWLLKNYAKQGDKILYTHFGSLSIGIACYNLDFDLTAFEIDADYFEAGKARLEEHRKQYRLFGA